MKKLSKNFSLESLTKSNTAIRLGIDNIPTAEDVIANLSHLCKTTLEPLFTLLGDMSITSGYRCESLNKKVGGSKKSQHCKGQAVDVVFNSCNLKKAFSKIIKSDIMFDQLIFEFNSLIHISSSDNPRKEILIAEKVDGKTVYTNYKA